MARKKERENPKRKSKEREEYEVIIQNGKFVHKQNSCLMNTPKGMKWIYVLSTSKKLLVGIKDKGVFQHSSFLAGATVISAGRLVVSDGILKAIWPYSGHYVPTEESFQRLIQFLDEQHVDLTDVKLCAIDDDVIATIVIKSDTNSAKNLCHGSHKPDVDEKLRAAIIRVRALLGLGVMEGVNKNYFH